MHRLTKRQADELRRSLIAAQDNRCALCEDTLEGKTACLDHDHRTGLIRSVLCLNCNGIEGKIFNLCRRAKRNSTEVNFLASVYLYWLSHTPERSTGLTHPAHRTPEEKRVLRNKRARLRRKNKA